MWNEPREASQQTCGLEHHVRMSGATGLREANGDAAVVRHGELRVRERRACRISTQALAPRRVPRIDGDSRVH